LIIIVQGGGTYFRNAFTAAYNLINQSRLQEFSAQCYTAILFLTDGVNSDSPQFDSAEIDALNAALPGNIVDPILFTYSLGTGADDVVPKELAWYYGFV
jgi:hypothetical protein